MHNSTIFFAFIEFRRTELCADLYDALETSIGFIENIHLDYSNEKSVSLTLPCEPCLFSHPN